MWLTATMENQELDRSMLLDMLPDDVMQVLIPHAVCALGKPEHEASSLQRWRRLRSRRHFASLSLISQRMKRAVDLYLADLCHPPHAAAAATWIQSQALCQIVRQRMRDTRMDGDFHPDKEGMWQVADSIQMTEFAEIVRLLWPESRQYMTRLKQIFTRQPMGPGGYFDRCAQGYFAR